MDNHRIATHGPASGVVSWLNRLLCSLSSLMRRNRDTHCPLTLGLLAIAALSFMSLATPAVAQTAPAQTAWRLLDYIAVDYPEAVADGKIANAGEYAEMQEFSATAAKLIGELPPSLQVAGLERQASNLQRIIAAKAPPPAIATAARGLAADLIKAYPLPLAPASAPDVARGKALYAQHCASCRQPPTPRLTSLTAGRG